MKIVIPNNAEAIAAMAAELVKHGVHFSGYEDSNKLYYVFEFDGAY